MLFDHVEYHWLRRYNAGLTLNSEMRARCCDLSFELKNGEFQASVRNKENIPKY